MIGKDYAEEISITFFMVMSEEKRDEDVDKKISVEERKQLTWETTIKVRNEDGQNLLWERELYTPLFC